MGCFSYTCSISGVPIEWSTPIRFIALAANPEGEHYGLPIGSAWQPLTFPIRGQYNDYGSVEELEEGPVTEAFFQALEVAAIERDVGENRVHDVAVKRGMGRRQWLSALWEERVQIKGRVQPVVDVVQGMVREDVWQFLVEQSRDLLLDKVSRHALRRQLEIDTRIDRAIIHNPSLDTAVLELNAVCRGLSRLGRPWRAGTCCGPQFPEWELHLAFLEQLTAIAKREVERIADEQSSTDE